MMTRAYGASVKITPVVGIKIMSKYDGFEWYENAPDGVTPQPPTKYERVVKTCRMCDREMDMSSDHGVCDSCASDMERGVEW